MAGVRIIPVGEAVAGRRAIGTVGGGGGIRTHEEEQPPTAFRVPRTRPDYATPPESPGLYPPGRRSSLTRPGLIQHRTLVYSAGAIRGPRP